MIERACFGGTLLWSICVCERMWVWEVARCCVRQSMPEMVGGWEKGGGKRKCVVEQGCTFFGEEKKEIDKFVRLARWRPWGGKRKALNQERKRVCVRVCGWTHVCVDVCACVCVCLWHA